MKKVKLITAIILFFYSNLFAQYSTDWIRPAESYQKIGVMIARDNQDNAIATGYWTSNNMYTRKYNKFGVLQWEAMSASGIQSEYERPVWVTTDNNNNVFVAGYRYAGTSSPIAVIVLKYSPDGVQLWKKVISPVNYLVGMSLRCEVDNNGNLYVGACGVGALPGFALIKFDTNGNILFTQNSDANAPKYFGSMRLKGNKIVMTASGGNPNIAVVAAWDTTGAFLWSAGVQGRGGSDVEIDDAGNVYSLTGYFNQVTATSQNDIEIFKFNASGTQLWKKDFDFGSGTDLPTRFTYIAGKLSIIGESQGAGFDWITFQVNTDGTMLWNTRYNGTSGNDEAPYFIAAKANGEVFVTGKGGPTPDPNNLSYLRMITLKYSNTGVQKWIDSTNIYSGWGYGCTLASDSSLFVLSGTNMTVFHFLDHTGLGTCNTPTGLNVSNIANNLATFSWTAVPGATLYHLRYKTTSANTWTVASYNLTTMNIFGLYAGTTYEYSVEAVCSNGPSGYAATQTFTTTGTAICSSVGQSQSQEYLSQLWLGIIHNSGRDNGYGDFTHIVIPLTRDQNAQGYLSGLVPYPEYEYYSIWIDYNHNNDFTDAGEEVVTLYTDFTGLVAFNFTVPSAAPLGPTRMRVIMSHDNPPIPCGAYARGETEDYTVFINDTSTVPPPVPSGLSVSNITNASATFTWTPDISAASYHLRYKKTTETTWTIAPVNVTSITVPALSSSTAYNFSCEAVGSIGPSGYGATQTFTTLGVVLPINGIEIKVRRQGGNVIVNWSTQSEQSSAFFDVERSYDGIAFTKIGQVNAAGYSSTPRNYQFTDVDAAKSLIFYRLKLVDADGSYRLSLVRLVTRQDGNKQDFLLYPNPAISNVNIALNEAAAEDMQVQVINQMGQIVGTTRLIKGMQLIKLDISKLPKGIYSVKITGNEVLQIKKLVKD